MMPSRSRTSLCSPSTWSLSLLQSFSEQVSGSPVGVSWSHSDTAAAGVSAAASPSDDAAAVISPSVGVKTEGSSTAGELEIGLTGFSFSGDNLLTRFSSSSCIKIQFFMNKVTSTELLICRFNTIRPSEFQITFVIIQLYWALCRM